MQNNLETMEETKKVPVSVYAESTPNPGTMKFVTNLTLVNAGRTVEYNSVEETENAPLAARLFSFPFVTGVFFAGNFISIKKNDLVEWQEVFGELRDYITNYITTGHDIFTIEPEGEKIIESSGEEKKPEITATIDHVPPSNDVEERIIGILEEYVRPAVENDGGAIHFNKYEEGKLTVVLKGACSGCPSSTVTLKNGIQGLFDSMMPEVKEIVALED